MTMAKAMAMEMAMAIVCCLLRVLCQSSIPDFSDESQHKQVFLLRVVLSRGPDRNAWFLDLSLPLGS